MPSMSCRFNLDKQMFYMNIKCPKIYHLISAIALWVLFNLLENDNIFVIASFHYLIWIHGTRSKKYYSLITSKRPSWKRNKSWEFGPIYGTQKMIWHLFFLWMLYVCNQYKLDGVLASNLFSGNSHTIYTLMVLCKFHLNNGISARQKGYTVCINFHVFAMLHHNEETLSFVQFLILKIRWNAIVLKTLDVCACGT